jgi:hypothetical protein
MLSSWMPYVSYRVQQMAVSLEYPSPSACPLTSTPRMFLPKAPRSPTNHGAVTTRRCSPQSTSHRCSQFRPRRCVHVRARYGKWARLQHAIGSRVSSHPLPVSLLRGKENSRLATKLATTTVCCLLLLLLSESSRFRSAPVLLGRDFRGAVSFSASN